MISQFKNKKQLLSFFSTEKACIDYISSQRWEDEITCPHCGASNPYITATRSKKLELQGTNDYKCRVKGCHKKFNALTNTIFENTKIDLKLWFEAIYVITNYKKGVSSLQIARDLGCTQKTAWFILHRVRNGMQEKAPEMLGSDGEIVEVDETYVGGKVKNMSNKKRKQMAEDKAAGKNTEMSNKATVMGFAERNGKIRLQVIEGRGGIKDAVLSNVSPNAGLMTDTSGVYKGFDKVYTQHKVIDHAKGKYADGKTHTNTVEGFFSMLDRGIIGIYHYVSPKHMQRYCDEFGCRYNTRDMTDIQRFGVIVKMSTSARLTYALLTAKKK